MHKLNALAKISPLNYKQTLRIFTLDTLRMYLCHSHFCPFRQYGIIDFDYFLGFLSIRKLFSTCNATVYHCMMNVT